MILTVASYKGGVGKTTTAVHLAAYLHSLSPTLLLDGDKTKNATAWSQRGGFPFRVAPIDAASKLARDYAHVVIDTGQRPSDEDLEAAVEGCDLLVIPAVPSALDSDGLGQTIRALKKIKATNFKVLLTRVAHDASKEATELRRLLAGIHAPVFHTEIPRFKAFEKAAAAGGLVAQVDDLNADRAAKAYLAAGLELGVELRSVVDASREGKGGKR
jgi:chromosome partitioning protein